ncbi:MAG: hypothetical protein ACO1OB_29105 [Archangium sp.]
MPAEGAKIPANTPRFVTAARDEYRGQLEDGGVGVFVFNESLVRSDVGALTAVDGGQDKYTQLYDTGPLHVGQRFTLQDAGVEVTVQPPAPFPSSAGTMTLGPIRLGARWCSFGEPPRQMVRDVFLKLSAEAEPWRNVAQVRVSRPPPVVLAAPVVEFPFSRLYGALPADEGELGVPMGQLVVDCDDAPRRHEYEIEMRFEIAGAPTQAEPIRQRVVMDCAERPPVGCASSPAMLISGLSLLLIRRSRLRR